MCVSLFYVIDTGSIGPRARIEMGVTYLPFVCQSEFCPGLWIKSRVLVNYCTIRAIVKIKMVLKVVFGTSLPIVNRRVRCTKREESGMQRSVRGGAGNGLSLGISERAGSTGTCRCV